ncbi:MAG: NADH-quinone oxidoreductase subunit NuoH [Planctomycetales bacterium]|nr:NADH-quinone oxidoreductase subunit NuoH [Planctomycetales bacterium]
MSLTTQTIEALIKLAIVAGGVMTAAMYLVLVERKMAGWIQGRLGPNRVGIPLTKIRLFGLGQPVADALKLILKEDVTPAHVNRRIYNLAPLIIMTAAVSVFAVIPFGSIIPGEGLGRENPIPLVVAPGIDVGMIFVFALSSIAVYGVILGGWASNNKYSFLGALRSSAQMIAYELPLGLGLLGVVLATGSLQLEKVIGVQADTGIWFALSQPLGFVVFVVAAFAEAARLPFDLTECEQELVAGFHTEYSGMRLVLFLTAEFIHMITAAFLIVILFLGGWHFWGLTGGSEDAVTWLGAIVRIVVFMIKILAVILFFMLVRWSWPRFRFDQLMNLAWKMMLPLGIVNLIAVAIAVEMSASAGASLPWIVYGWIVAVVAWMVTAVCSPLMTDNTARVGDATVGAPLEKAG